MAYSIINYTGDGVTTQYAINFGLGILARTDVQCRVNNEVDGLSQPVYRSLTWINDGLVQIQGAVPGVGVPIKFTRTVSKTTLIHDYTNGEPIEESNLDDTAKQTLMAVQEVLDGRLQDGLAQDLNAGTYRITNMGNAVNAQDAVTKSQLEDYTGNAPAYAAAAAASASAANTSAGTATTQAGLAATAKTDAEAARDAAQAAAAGMKWRPDVKVATTANITLSGTQTIDGVAVIAGDRVLVKNQTTTSQNGVYVVAAGAWSRATDADTWNELISQVVSVQQGTLNADLIFICTVDSGGTIGSTAVTWVSINLPLQDNEVTTNKIIDGAVTFLKIASAAIASASDIINAVANKLVTAANFKAGLRGLESYTLLSSQTLSAAATANFTSLITSEFDTYVFEFIGVQPATVSVTFHMRMSNDNGATWISGAGTYAGAVIGTTSGTTTVANIGYSDDKLLLSCNGTVGGLIGNGAAQGCNGFIKLYDPMSTTKYKTIVGQITHSRDNNEQSFANPSGRQSGTGSAVNAVQFFFSSGNIAAGTIRMYGVRKV